MRKIIIGCITVTALLIGGTGVAMADPSVGESGHSNNGSTQCQAGSVDHCPPFGP